MENVETNKLIYGYYNFSPRLWGPVVLPAPLPPALSLESTLVVVVVGGSGSRLVLPPTIPTYVGWW